MCGPVRPDEISGTRAPGWGRRARPSWLNGLKLFDGPESFHPSRNGQSSGYLPLVRVVVE